MTVPVPLDLSAAEAREKVDTVKALVSDAWAEVADLYRGRAWLALGYTSWDVLCDAEFEGARIRLPREERREVVGSLREAGLSTRAIASAVGLSEGTVRNDLAGAQDYAPAPVTGTDGKSYAPTQSPRLASAPAEEWPEPALPGPTLSPAPEWADDQRDLIKRLRDGATVVISMRGQDVRFLDYLDEEGLFARIDRRTEWGNPFEVPADGDRETVIRNYAEHYLPHKPSLLSQVDTLRGKALGCWCAPEPCHGDVLRARADR